MKITRYLKNYKRKDGTSQVYIRERELNIYFPTGVYVSDDDWDDDNKMVKGRGKSSNDKNLMISQVESKITDILIKYRLKDIPITKDLLKAEYYNPQIGLNFISFAWESFHRSTMEDSTARHHKSVLKKIDNMFNGQLYFADLNAKTIQQIERELTLLHGNKRNTVVANIKVVKKYINEAIRHELIDKNPAHGMPFKFVPSERTSLTLSELKALECAYENGRYKHAQGIERSLKHYLFMCYTGLRISDFKRLTHKNVINNMLAFVMQKTNNVKKTKVYVPLTMSALALIESEDPGALLFKPRPSQKINEDLKRIAADAGIEKNLTIHTARHTFATLYLNATNDLAGLQELLGHENIETTRQYIHIDQEHLFKNMQLFEQSRHENE